MPDQMLLHFRSIGLDALNSKAQLMDRKDNKYVLDTAQVKMFLDYACQRHDALEIDGKRQFYYVNLYFDSKDFRTHLDHNKGRRKRIKMRYRQYFDSDRHYFEIKLKGLRNVTLKERVRLDDQESLVLNGELHPRLQSFCQEVLLDNGYERWAYGFVPSLAVYYDRMTLVERDGDERITIDHGIAFSEMLGGPKFYLNNDRWIVEVKSETGRTESDLWLLRNHIRPLSTCSKYGMGVTILKQDGRNNRFGEILRRQFDF